MQTRIFLMALSATLIGTQNAAAQNASEDPEVKSFYADIGYHRIGDDIFGDSHPEFSRDYDALNAHIGYRFSKFWSVEAEAMVGVDSDEYDYSYIYELDVTTYERSSDLNHLIGVYARGDIPITSKLNGFARLGIASAETEESWYVTKTNLDTGEVTSSPAIPYTETDMGTVYGLGLTYDMTDRLYLRTDINFYNLEDTKMENLGVGIGVRF